MDGNLKAFSSTGNTGQPLVGEIYPSHDDDSENPGIDPVTVLLQPSPLQSQASGSAPHQIHHHHHHHPGSTSINRNDADFQYQYDTSTNPYTSLSVMQMPLPPWNIPSQPQVQIPPQFVGYGQRLLANQNQNSNYHPSPSSTQAPTFSVSPLPPLPLGYGSLALGVSYPSDAVCDPFNLMLPCFWTSQDTGCEDEFPGPRDPIAATAHPEDDSTFVIIGDRATGEERRGRGRSWREAAKPVLGKVCDGFGLRLPIWTQASETEYQDAVIGDLLDEQFFPPKFVMGQGTDDELHFLENRLCLMSSWTLFGNSSSSYLEDPGSLACAAAAAVRCAIEKAKSKKVPTNAEEMGGLQTCIKVRLAQYK
ncbi:hypothetical protein EDD22DRAFT_853006 [Suillus occidentalis]|nr:hypothetical protein EDD22DRAFT_853006 [Suillus occidentalis]